MKHSEAPKWYSLIYRVRILQWPYMNPLVRISGHRENSIAV